METVETTAMVPLDDLGGGGDSGDTLTHNTSGAQNGADKYSNTTPPTVINIKRRMYTRDELERAYPLQNEEFSIKGYVRRKCICSMPRIRKVFFGYLPFIGVIRNYHWRVDLLSDFIAGVCVAFLHIPQGLALGLLASVPPVFGLYTTFFPTLFYMIFGTSIHTSMGTNAVISLLIAGIIDTQLNTRAATGTNITTISALSTIPTTISATTSTESIISTALDVTDDVNLDLVAFKVGVASSVGLLSGLYLTVAGLLRLGFVTRYFSSAFLGGFTTATAVHIVVSQLSKLLNIQIGVHAGAGKLVKIIVDVFQNIGAANPADVIISVISVAFLLAITILVNEKYKEKLKIPVPVQLILVAISTAVSHLADLQGRFGVAVVGAVPSGLPSPSVPDIGAYPGIASESIMVAFLTFTISISIGKLTAKIHNYDIEDSQELLAYGLTNTLSSFFSCYTSCNNPPRAMVLGAVGAKSVLNGVFCAILILIVLLVASPLFQDLPVAVLAAMICVALKNILLQVKQLPFLWNTSKPDFIVWVLTCLISIFVDLDIGIIAGILISFLTIVVKSQITSGTIGAVSGREDLIHLDGNRKGMKPSDDFAIFYFPSQLYFANVEKFKKELFTKVLNPNTSLKTVSNGLNEPENKETIVKEDSYKMSRLLPKHLILDCSAMTYMDLDGANMLKTISGLYKNSGVNVLLANCSDCVLTLLENVGYFENIPRDSTFHDIYDAVNFVKMEN